MNTPDTTPDTASQAARPSDAIAWAVLIVIIAGGLWALANTGNETSPVPTANPVATLAPAVDSLREAGRQAVAQFEAEQWVKLNPENHRGSIKSEMWRSVNAERKELVTMMLARECAVRRGDESLRFELFDEHTGKRLASYSSWSGFKVD